MKSILLIASILFSVTVNADDKGCRPADVYFIRHDTPTTYWVQQGPVVGSLKILDGSRINREGPTRVNLRVDAVTVKADGEWVWIWTQCL